VFNPRSVALRSPVSRPQHCDFTSIELFSTRTGAAYETLSNFLLGDTVGPTSRHTTG